jgi:hypothetical protein
LPDAPARWQEFFQRAFSSRSDLRPQSAEGFLTELDTAFA